MQLEGKVVVMVSCELVMLSTQFLSPLETCCASVNENVWVFFLGIPCGFHLED